MEGARKTIAEMMAEAFREVAVLIIVFAPLDRWVEHRAYGWTDFWQTFGIKWYSSRDRNFAGTAATPLRHYAARDGILSA